MAMGWPTTQQVNRNLSALNGKISVKSQIYSWQISEKPPANIEHAGG
jgi:hypothetical protein